jgi:uncharacterized protein
LNSFKDLCVSRYRYAMTFNDNAQIDSSKVSRRGRNTAIGVGGGGGLAIIIVIVASVLGINPDLLSGLTGGTTEQTDPGTSLANCDTGAQANADINCRVAGAATSISKYWTDAAPNLGFDYTDPQPTVVFDGSTDTGCGPATTAVGPFYCPADQTIYIDTSFYDLLQSQFGASAGSLAQMYVIAHEWGHHVQHISGITDGLDLQATGRGSDSVRLELQADCFAGSWAGEAATTEDANGITFLKPFTKAELADALNAAATVGDDNIQETTQGRSNPETWTHGSSASRQKWFEAGYQSGPTACDTFGVAVGDL